MNINTVRIVHERGPFRRSYDGAADVSWTSHAWPPFAFVFRKLNLVNNVPAASAPTQDENMSTVLFEKDGAVGVVTLSNPPHNLIGDTLMTDLLSAYNVAVEQGCRAILLRSAMRHFCAGADVDGFGGGGGGGGRRHDQAAFDSVLDSLENVAIPTVAAVHGGALGGGFELALTCDMIVAADTAFFGMPEASLGLIPLLGGVQRVVQRVGPARAKEMAMFGRRHDPASLERWGVINLVIAESELPSVSMSWARQLAAGATVALKGIKQLANHSARSGIAGADMRQIEVNEMMWASADQKRGLDAFAKTGPGSAVFEGN
jgi:enoyl-CoA hydratase/carnithine racemase